jgi:LemA protein
MKRIQHILFFVIISSLLSSCGYNSMVEMDEGITGQWAQVENVYQRRSDLIPNLVATVKGYASHEKGTLESVMAARSQATSMKIDAANLTPEKLKAFENAQSQLGSSLARLMAVAENYPNLKASEQFLSLQAQLEGSENRITEERRKFNEKVNLYNTYIRKFPNNFTASLFSFEKRPYFEADKGAEDVPKVNFE